MEERNFDYNLLLIFETLFDEKNVSRAAERLGLTQPAVSNALNRLRDQFGDPLFIRSAAGMQPTPRALTLKEPISSALRTLRENVFQSQKFDPKTSKRVFRLATTDYGELVILPRMCRELATVAPSIQMEIRNMSRQVPVAELASGELDLAIGFFVDEENGSLYKQTLFEEHFVSLVRKGHPRIKGKLSLAAFTEERHLLVSPWGGMSGVVDEMLRKKDQSRNVAVTFPHFLMAPMVIAETDDVVTLPSRVAEAFKKVLPIQILETPLKPPTFPANLIWHERTHHDPASQWLRGFIRSLI